MEDKIIIWGVEVASSTEWIVLAPNSIWYRREICKNFWKISCRDSYAYESGWLPWLKTCSVYWNEKNFTAYSELSSLVNIWDEKVFWFFHKSIDCQSWHLTSLLEQDFYQNLDIQECFWNTTQEKNITFSWMQMSWPFEYKEIKTDYQNHYFLISVFVLIIGFLILFIKFSQKLRNKSPQK